MTVYIPGVLVWPQVALGIALGIPRYRDWRGLGAVCAITSTHTTGWSEQVIAHELLRRPGDLCPSSDFGSTKDPFVTHLHPASIAVWLLPCERVRDRTVSFYVPVIAAYDRGLYLKLLGHLRRKAIREERASKRKHVWREFYHAQVAAVEVKHQFAMTVRRSQGSTFGTVYLDLSGLRGKRPSPDNLRLLYTAATRPKHALVITSD